MVVTGKHGSLALKFEMSEPNFNFPDWQRTDGGKYKAVCHLEANGRAVGWFIEKKDESGDPSKDTMVFFPEMRRRDPAQHALTAPPKPAKGKVKKPARTSRPAKKVR